MEHQFVNAVFVVDRFAQLEQRRTDTSVHFEIQTLTEAEEENGVCCFVQEVEVRRGGRESPNP